MSEVEKDSEILELKEEVSELQKRVDELEKENQTLWENLADRDKRLDEASEGSQSEVTQPGLSATEAQSQEKSWMRNFDIFVKFVGEMRFSLRERAWLP
jgi:regulator of replication initiation timing